MKRTIGRCISIFSIIIGIFIIIGGYFLWGKRGFQEGAPGWILGTIGAPITFLSWVVEKLGLSRSITSQYIWLSIFYLLQYQLIAVLIYKGVIDLTSKKGIICIIVIVVTIFLSAVTMWNIIMGRWLL